MMAVGPALIIPQEGGERSWAVMDDRGLDFGFGLRWQAEEFGRGITEPPWGNAQRREEQEHEWENRRTEMWETTAARQGNVAQERREFMAW